MTRVSIKTGQTATAADKRKTPRYSGFSARFACTAQPSVTESSHVPLARIVWHQTAHQHQTNEEAAHENGRVRIDKSPLVSDDPRLHQQESNEDGHHVDVKAVSQDAVALDRVELLRKF